ncbi:hypothetical protein QJS04_geneDACA006105 [Acorus gramineus]|uniref:Uncharacterized protein n=1 Tax=Acorus gramineus TaxID=55184 RepID=A0AAV9B113_ACOGR|nr:hypothetical protein QJS04_geneDACA006105 [Acorus gramineus]
MNMSSNGGQYRVKDPDFNPGAPPPFGLAEIRAAIPKHCWVKDPWRSMSYVIRDVTAVAALAAGAAYLNNWVVWFLYWVCQGTMFWALFVLGHDCGHGSFSNNPTLNSVVGHFLHSFILVPYNGWRISHRTHHQNHGHVENDESWHPLPERIYNNMGSLTKKVRFTVPFPMLAFPVYLWTRSPGKKGSHFHPESDLFVPREKDVVITSTVCWSAMAALLAGLEWNYLRGALTTLDRDYGWINNVHHDIGTHVIHHLFPQIPHYNLREATKAARPVLDKYYREPQISGPLPFHLFGDLMRSMRSDHYVEDNGDVLYYQTDPQLFGGSAKKFI